MIKKTNIRVQITLNKELLENFKKIVFVTKKHVTTSKAIELLIKDWMEIHKYD